MSDPLVSSFPSAGIASVYQHCWSHMCRTPAMSFENQLVQNLLHPIRDAFPELCGWRKEWQLPLEGQESTLLQSYGLLFIVLSIGDLELGFSPPGTGLVTLGFGAVLPLAVWSLELKWRRTWVWGKHLISRCLFFFFNEYSRLQLNVCLGCG